MNNDSNDLIKRGAVCDMLHEEMEAWGSCADEIEALLKANDALWEIPAVDAVEAVRCKDCKYRGEYECPMYHEEYYWDEDDGGDYIDIDNTHHDGFCDRGERRTDG